jgi:hypothetical protein
LVAPLNAALPLESETVTFIGGTPALATDAATKNRQSPKVGNEFFIR